MTLQLSNIDAATVEGFGKEWNAFTQEDLADKERAEVFANTFHSLTGPTSHRES